MKRFTIILALSLLVCAAGISISAAKTEVGKYHTVNIDTARQYQGSSNGATTLVWEYTINHPGATFISIHFKDFHLAGRDYLQISDAEGGQSYTLTGKGKMDMEEFWARHIKGDTAVLQLYATSRSGGQGFIIDTYSAGFQSLNLNVSIDEDIDDDFEDPISILSTCGGSDFENAKCYLGTTEYNKARAVARLLIRGRYLCTGSLVSAEGHFLTNAHCMDTSFEWGNTDYEFDAETDACGDNNCMMCWPGDIYETVVWHATNAAMDYTLVQFTGANPADTYGYLQFEDDLPSAGDKIYMPGHPEGYAKLFGIKSDHPYDTAFNDESCHVFSTTRPPCAYGADYYDIGYYCDSEGGSSGGPVLDRVTHKMVALHHCGGCPNTAVPIHKVNEDLVSKGIVLDSGPECTEDTDCDDGQHCTGEEACVDGDCVPGTDPCSAGEVCNEDTDECEVPYCGDDICTEEDGEDPCTCPGDCGALEADFCTDEIDNDCDGNTDCDDGDCAGDSACQECLDYGETCTAHDDCCSNYCRFRRGAYTCW